MANKGKETAVLASLRLASPGDLSEVEGKVELSPRVTIPCPDH